MKSKLFLIFSSCMSWRITRFIRFKLGRFAGSLISNTLPVWLRLKEEQG
jgi:hypothetical protein